MNFSDTKNANINTGRAQEIQGEQMSNANQNCRKEGLVNPKF